MLSPTRFDTAEPDDVVCQVAKIFAEGVLRLYWLGHLPLGPDGLSAETALNSAIQDLEQSRKTRLSVTRG